MESRVVIVDGYRDRSGDVSVFKRVLRNYGAKNRVVCFNARKLHSVCIPSRAPVIDVQLLFPTDHFYFLSSIVKKLDTECKGDFLELDKKISAHVRAIKESKIDVTNVPLKRLVPLDLLNSYMEVRLSAIKEIFERFSEDELKTYETLVLPTFLDVVEMEQSKIKIDKDLVSKLSEQDIPHHERRFFSKLATITKDGFVWTRISPVGSKTWRLRVVDGFDCMAIPHGSPRKCVVSRFSGGTIAALDFNAIDYRSIISSMNDSWLNQRYSGNDDFHRVTASFVSGGEVSEKLRDVVKKITYSYVYGSSRETIQKSTGLLASELDCILTKLDKVFGPISQFRKRLSEEARKNGFVRTPSGYVTNVGKEDHDGKILGLYAQTHSSFVLNNALNIALSHIRTNNLRSKVIFTVHDEIVIDVCPQERNVVQDIKTAIESKTCFSMKSKEGANYDEATQ